MGRCLGLILGCVLLIAGQGRADVQTSPDLAVHAAADLRQILPSGFEVTVVGPLTLKIGPKATEPIQVNLDRINAHCMAAPDRCDAVLGDFVAKVAQLLRDKMAPLSKEQLRAVVRPVEYLDELRRGLGTQEVVSAPLIDDLVVMCFFDRPTAMLGATISNLKTLGLTSDDAIALCKRNVEAALPPLQSQIKSLPDRSFGTLTGDPYQSSRLIFHDDWEPVAAEFGGHLIVAIPASDLVIYGKEQDAVALNAMASVTKKLFVQAQRRISTKVFRWTPTGWDIAAP